MADEEKSVLSSLSGLLVDTVTGNSKRLLEATRRESLKASLASDAKANTVLNGGFKGTNVVESPLIRCMMNAYRAASTGRVIVVCTHTDRFRVFDARKSPLAPQAISQNLCCIDEKLSCRIFTGSLRRE